MSRFNKPTDWETTKAFTDFEPLELGGHVCKIMKVEEGTSRSGKDMILIYLDIAEGEQKGYYADSYRANNRSGKKWGCIVYQLLDDTQGNTNRGFKTFVDCVASSNPGFDVNQIWNENFCNYFKDKLIGGVFGREQYPVDNGSLKFRIKCCRFTTAEKARKGIAPPPDKLINLDDEYAAMVFTQVDGSNDTLPF